MTVHYLEFSSPEEHHHKFYEITVDRQTVTIRFGKIGTAGTKQFKQYSSSEEAERDAERKIKEKQKKGYQFKNIAPPIQATVSPEKSLPKEMRTTAKSPSPKQSASKSFDFLASEPFLAPILWQFNSGFSSLGLAIENQYCWLGNEKGRVLKIDQGGQILEQYQLPRTVKSIVTDDIWVYVGCDNGLVYDMTGKFPYVAYEIESASDIFWLDINDGILGVSDANGALTKIDQEGEIIWSRLSSGIQGWMLRCDAQGFYHGHSKGLTMYDREKGLQLWHQSTVGKVLFGCQTANSLYVATSGKQVQEFDKIGHLRGNYLCDASVYSCAVDEERGVIFAGDSSGFVYGFHPTGKRLWKVKTGCGSALSMQFSPGSGNQLYIATNQGILACMDVSEMALRAAIKGELPSSLAVENTLSHVPMPQHELEPVNTATSGIVLECFRQGERLRVRVVSAGYHADWMVQFPRNLRQEGNRYLVQGLQESNQGFYRIQGDIKRLV